jgi:hypothetical protein
MDFCLIFVPFGHYDEPEILPYENPSICPRGADVRQYGHDATQKHSFFEHQNRPSGSRRKRGIGLVNSGRVF